MPHVIVKLWPGKTENQKRQLADSITQSVMRTLNYGEESVSVAFEEVESKDWAAKVYRADIVSNESRLYKRPGYTMEWPQARRTGWPLRYDAYQARDHQYLYRRHRR